LIETPLPPLQPPARAEASIFFVLNVPRDPAPPLHEILLLSADWRAVGGAPGQGPLVRGRAGPAQPLLQLIPAVARLTKCTPVGTWGRIAYL
jgi:hypothetical protein